MNIQSFTTIIQESEIDEESKQMILGKLNDASLSDEQKIAVISEFITVSQDEIAKTDKDALDAIYKDADAEMAQAEKEYEATMRELSEEALKVDQEVSAAIDSANA